MNVFGLLITRDDEAILGEWCRDQLRFYDTVVCLDGSGSDASERILRPFEGRVVYIHERDCAIPYKTDHGLRRIAHQEIVRRFGCDNWVMCCHADEFCYHDPRKIARKAEQEGYDLVRWFSLHFLPHPAELADWPQRQVLPIQERFRNYHWGWRDSDLPWSEHRLYRNAPHVQWDQVTHGCVRPHGVERPAPFHPVLRHYKVFRTDLDWYEARGASTFYRTHWTGLQHRTGLPFSVRRLEDLFVSVLPEYAYCDRFDGTLLQEWNMGEEFRPDPMSGTATIKLSIVVSVLNSHEVVRRQLLHLSRILTPECELILVDDGSDPGLSETCASVAKPFQFVLHCTHDRRPWTQPRGRNLGASLAKGERLLFFDVDHILTEEVVRFSLNYSGDKLHWVRRPAVLDEQGRLMTDPVILRDHGLTSDAPGVHGNSFLIRKSLFDRLGGYDERFCGRYGGDDVDFNDRYQALCRQGLAKAEEIRGLGYVFPDPARDVKKLFHSLSRNS